MRARTTDLSLEILKTSIQLRMNLGLMLLSDKWTSKCPPKILSPYNCNGLQGKSGDKKTNGC